MMNTIYLPYVLCELDFQKENNDTENYIKNRALYKGLFIIIIIMSINSSFGQKVIYGKVLDKNSKKPISYATIQVRSLGIGTVTNEGGIFKIMLANNAVDSLSISCIGYNTSSVSVYNILTKSNVAELEPCEQKLPEVIVFPDSALRNLLKITFDNINKSYYQKPTALHGFYRESKSTEKGKFIYFGEAILNILKTGYQFHRDDGRVRMIKSRVMNSPLSDSIINIKFFGGPFLAHKIDYVKNRSSFINPKNYFSFKYYLEKIIQSDGRKIYQISFQSLKDDLNGRLFIDEKNRVYERVEVDERIDKILPSITHSFRWLFRHSEVTYSRFCGKQFLRHCIRKTQGFDKKKNVNIYGNSEFLTSEIDTTSNLMNFAGVELSYGNIFSQQVSDFSDDYWKDHTILYTDSLLNKFSSISTSDSVQRLLSNPFRYNQVNKSFRAKAAQLVPKFSTHFQLISFPYSDLMKSTELVFNRTQLTSASAFKLPITLVADMRYRLNTCWEINAASSINLVDQFRFSLYEVGLNWFTLLNRINKPLYIRPSLYVTYYNFGTKVGSLNTKDSQFDNQRINFDRANLLIGQRFFGLRPAVDISLKWKRIWYFSTQVGYYLPIVQNQRVYLKQTSGFFLTRKIVSAQVEPEDVDYRLNGQQTNSFFNYCPLYLSVGLRAQFY